MKIFPAIFVVMCSLVSLLSLPPAAFAEDGVPQMIQRYLEGTVLIETVRPLPFKEHDVMTALQSAIENNKQQVDQFVERAVLLLPASVKNIVNTAIAAYPSAVALIVSAAIKAAPEAAVVVVTAAITALPEEAVNIVTAAVTAAPAAAVNIVTAAITAAPDVAGGIVAAAIAAAPEQAVAIVEASPAPAAGNQNVPAASQEIVTPEGVPIQEPVPSPTRP